MKQKEIFLESEGNQWFTRNEKHLRTKKLPDDDALLLEIRDLLTQTGQSASDLKILEVGCGNGYRLAWLQKHMKMDCYGIDPSTSAIAEAKQQGVKAVVGTADIIPFDSGFFDIIVFGFCLYLCDRADLFKIAQEADKALKPKGWLIILDFFSAAPVANKYHHFEGLFSYKMDYRSLFLWHPFYACYSHKIRDFHKPGFPLTDNPEEMTAISIIRKNSL